MVYMDSRVLIFFQIVSINNREVYFVLQISTFAVEVHKDMAPSNGFQGQ